MQHQDWQQVVFRKPKPSERIIEAPKTMSSTTGMAAYKIDNADYAENPLKQVSREDMQYIIQGRVNKKLTQKDLAKQLNIQLKDIQDIESGKAIENKQLLSKIKRHLNK